MYTRLNYSGGLARLPAGGQTGRVILVLKTVIRHLADFLIFKTSKASNSNILVQTLTLRADSN